MLIVESNTKLCESKNINASWRRRVREDYQAEGWDEIIQIKDLCWYACWWFTMSGVNLNLQYIFFRSNFDNHQYFTLFKDNFVPTLLLQLCGIVICVIKMMKMMIFAYKSIRILITSTWNDYCILAGCQMLTFLSASFDWN